MCYGHMTRVKNIVFSEVTPCDLIAKYKHSVRSYCFSFRTEELINLTIKLDFCIVRKNNKLKFVFNNFRKENIKYI